MTGSLPCAADEFAALRGEVAAGAFERMTAEVRREFVLGVIRAAEGWYGRAQELLAKGTAAIEAATRINARAESALGLAVLTLDPRAPGPNRAERRRRGRQPH